MAGNVERVAVLGVDPGSGKGLGWAVMRQAIPPDAIKLLEYQHDWLKPELVASGVLKTPPMDKDDRSPLWDMLGGLLLEWLPGIHQTMREDGGGTANDVTALAYERVHRHNGVHAAHMYGGQVAVMQHMASAAGVPWIPVQVHTVKRFLNCRAAGRDKEQAMVDAARALGYNQVADHNEADAVGIALAGLDAWRTGQNVFGNLKGS